jgi:hypothetical protein
MVSFRHVRELCSRSRSQYHRQVQYRQIDLHLHITAKPTSAFGVDGARISTFQALRRTAARILRVRGSHNVEYGIREKNRTCMDKDCWRTGWHFFRSGLLPESWSKLSGVVMRASYNLRGRISFLRGALAMMANASRRRVDVVVFWALDRLTREGALETLQYLAILGRSPSRNGSATKNEYALDWTERKGKEPEVATRSVDPGQSFPATKHENSEREIAPGARLRANLASASRAFGEPVSIQWT